MDLRDCTWVNENWEEDHAPPYWIEFDDGIIEDFWGPQHCIRASSVPGPSKELGKLRFKVGQRVECNLDTGWQPGTITQVWYSESTTFQFGHVAPYQLQMDDGRHIYAPVDNDGCIRKSSIPPPTCWICFDNDQSETNLIVRDCACRGEESGFVHTDCLVQLAIAKTDNGFDCGEDLNPFEKCITCRETFLLCTRSFDALATACYDIHRNDYIGSFWKEYATEVMCQALSQKGEYDKAKALLIDQINLMRSIMSDVSMPSALMFRLAFSRGLSNYLMELAKVYEKLGALDEMKASLDESLELIKDFTSDSQMPILSLLARWSYLTGDKVLALKYFDECIAFERATCSSGMGHLSYLLVTSAVLNVELGDRDLGIEKLEEALKNNTMRYGRNHAMTQQAAIILRKACEGSGEIPPTMIGLDGKKIC